MFTGSLIRALSENDSMMVSLSIREIIETLGNSIVLGFVLALATFVVGRHLEKRSTSPTTAPQDSARDIFGSMNLMFLTVGLSGLMILINNSVLRAFAIVAAIAMVRFRVKLDSKALGSAMIFAILAGMACGVREFALAYVSVGVFLLLVGILLFLVRVIDMLENPATFQQKVQLKETEIISIRIP